MISEDLAPHKNFEWYDILDPRQEDFQTLTTKFHIPELLVLDTEKPEHLPKYETTAEGHFFILRSFDSNSSFKGATLRGLTRKLTLLISGNRLVTIRRVKLDYIEEFIKRSQDKKTRNLQHLVYDLILEIIKSYEAPLVKLQDQYAFFEKEILSRNQARLDTRRIYHFRRQSFVIKRILAQIGETLTHSKDFWEHHQSLLQDLKENLKLIYFQLEDISKNFDHLFQLHIALNDQRANEVMKVLTVFSTIFLPLNFLASFYGMNFTMIPGLKSWTAFTLLIIFMIVLIIIGIWYFKKKGWFNTYLE